MITEKQVPIRSSSLKTTSSFRAMAVRADNSIAVRDSADYRSLNFTSIFIKARQKLEFMAQGVKRHKRIR